MLVLGEMLFVLHVTHQTVSDQRLQDLAGNRCEADWTIVFRPLPVSLLEDWDHHTQFPVFRQAFLRDRFVIEDRERLSQMSSCFLQYSWVDVVRARRTCALQHAELGPYHVLGDFQIVDHMWVSRWWSALGNSGDVFLSKYRGEELVQDAGFHVVVMCQTAMLIPETVYARLIYCLLTQSSNQIH